MRHDVDVARGAPCTQMEHGWVWLVQGSLFPRKVFQLLDHEVNDDKPSHFAVVLSQDVRKTGQ